MANRIVSPKEMGIITKSLFNKADKTECALDELARLKSEKKKAKVILHLDGSGIVAKVEVSQFIQ
jgi:hypothetical protein